MSDDDDRTLNVDQAPDEWLGSTFASVVVRPSVSAGLSIKHLDRSNVGSDTTSLDFGAHTGAVRGHR